MIWWRIINTLSQSFLVLWRYTCFFQPFHWSGNCNKLNLSFSMCLHFGIYQRWNFMKFYTFESKDRDWWLNSKGNVYNNFKMKKIVCITIVQNIRPSMLVLVWYNIFLYPYSFFLKFHKRKKLFCVFEFLQVCEMSSFSMLCFYRVQRATKQNKAK